MRPCVDRFSSRYSQVITATLQGTVKDRSGATEANASVRIKDVSTNIVASTSTNVKGCFVFASLQPRGLYAVTIDAQGFKTEERQATLLEVNQAANITFVLQVPHRDSALSNLNAGGELKQRLLSRDAGQTSRQNSRNRVESTLESPQRPLNQACSSCPGIDR